MERKWWTLLAVCVATFMLLLDITVVNVALPDIQSDLDASLSSLQWVVDAYALTLAAFLLVAGSLADRIGRRRVFIVGFGIFTVASFAVRPRRATRRSSTSPAALQGIGGAAMFATSLALIAQEFQGRERGTAIGIWGATVGGAVAIGPLVGGADTEGLGWEWIFFVNVPIGIAAIFLTETKLANVKAHRSRSRSTGPASSTFSSALFVLIFGLIRGNAEGWGSAADPRLARRGGPCCCSPSWHRVAQRATRCSTCRCSGGRPSPASRSSLSRSRRGCSRCSSTSPSTSRTSSATRRFRPGCASCR